MSKIPAEEKSSSSNSPSLRIPNKSEQDTDKLDGDEQIQQLLKDYEEQFAATKETEGSLMSTIAQQREQIAQLQNQVQSNELEKKRLTDEIYFLRQKEYIIEQEAQVGQKSAHEEAKKSPKSASRPKDENKKGPSLRGDKKPAQESAPKTKSPDEKKTAAPSASKKPELAPKTQSTGQNKNDPTPEENKVESSQKATNINKKATSSPEEAKKAKPMPKDQKNVEAKSSSPTETKKRSKTPSKPADQAAKTPAPSEEVQPLKSEPTNSSQNEEIMDTQAVEPVKTAKVPAFKGSKPKQQPEVKKPELAKPAPEAPPQTLESSSPPTESTLETKPEKPTKNSPSIMPEEEKEVKPQITQPKTSSPGGSIFTRIQPNLFRFEVLPFLSHPREVAVLRCVDRQHSSMMNDRAQGIIAHFEQILYEMSKGMSEERMQETERVLQQAKDALNVVNKGDITELKSFLKPPVGAIQVAEVIVLLLTGNLKPDWASFKKLASDKSFIPRLINLDIPNIPKRAIQKCRQYLRAANYNPAAVRGVSAACASL